MRLTIRWDPQIKCWRVRSRQQEEIVLLEDVASDGPLAQYTKFFDVARKDKEAGSAIHSVTIDYPLKNCFAGLNSSLSLSQLNQRQP